MRATEQPKRPAAILGVGLDNDDGHTRLTRGKNFALVGGSHGHNELFQMLVTTAPDLASTVDRRGLFQQAIAQNVTRLAALEAEAAALTARTAQLNIGLSSMEDESTLTKTKEQQNKLSGKKRGLD